MQAATWSRAGDVGVGVSSPSAAGTPRRPRRAASSQVFSLGVGLVLAAGRQDDLDARRVAGHGADGDVVQVGRVDAPLEGGGQVLGLEVCAALASWSGPPRRRGWCRRPGPRRGGSRPGRGRTGRTPRRRPRWPPGRTGTRQMRMRAEKRFHDRTSCLSAAMAEPPAIARLVGRRGMRGSRGFFLASLASFAGLGRFFVGQVADDAALDHLAGATLSSTLTTTSSSFSLTETTVP